MWFQQDGWPEHYSMVALEVFEHHFNGDWIGRASPINWPAKLPEICSPNFFLWDHLKDKVSNQEPTTRENMIKQIRNVCPEIQADTFLRFNMH